jgi:hypothetical protein
MEKRAKENWKSYMSFVECYQGNTSPCEVVLSTAILNMTGFIPSMIPPTGMSLQLQGLSRLLESSASSLIH